MVHPIQLGKNVRQSFGRINEVIEMPNLIGIQKDSYEWFLDEGLKEVFHDISPITDYSGNLILEFLDYSIKAEDAKFSVAECKERDATYASTIKVKVRLINKETGEIKEQEVFMGDFPLMTPQGTFIINGAERVIVSQLVRSPGIYFDMQHEIKSGKELFTSQVIPNRGAWLEYETDVNDVCSVRIDRTRKLPVTVLVRALGYGSDAEINELFGYDARIMATLEKDTTTNTDEALLEIYKRLRPGEPLVVDSARSLLYGLLFDPRRYSLAKVGRYKFNLKLSMGARIRGYKLAEDAVNPFTGEIVFEAGKILSRADADLIEKLGVNSVMLELENGTTVKVFSNNMVELDQLVDASLIDDSYIEEITKSGEKIYKKVFYPALKEIMDEYADDEEGFKKALVSSVDVLIPPHIMIDDIMASINYCNNLGFGMGKTDDIDHLGNRRIRAVGELLQNQFRIGLTRMERVVRERMSIQDLDIITPQGLINTKPVISSIKEFFGSSQLSQFMDQPNPLAELTHKRRLSALGPGGLSRDRAGFEVRDVHYSHYGRICPIETPEGPNIGLINSLATFAKINKYGFVEGPYRKVDKETGKVLEDVTYMTADIEDEFIVAQANEPLDEENKFVNKKISARYKDEILEVDTSKVDYMDVSPRQVVSVATGLIPFLENDDANRALMGANMQRQAVPLLKPDSPIVGTGMEYRAAKDSGVAVCADRAGVVKSVSGDYITITADDGGIDEYKLLKFIRSNQGTCINQRPIVTVGERVGKGDVIADGPSTDNGELALGRNILIGFMTWEGYNYEDAMLINENLVKEDVFTSIHIEEYECEARDTKLGPEEITRDIPNVGDDSLKDLDERGIIRIGAEVKAGDILVGKVTPKGETDLTAEERLLRAIFGEKAREVRDTSLRVPHGEYGIIVDVKIFTRENSDELAPGVNQVVRCYIAQKRKISVGDTMAGRHGNKGVISRILPQEDMPFLPDGTPLQIVLNPLGVPSRMNIGQVLEVHLGYAAKMMGWKIATHVFDGATEENIAELLEKVGSTPDGKTVLYDGRTGEPFDNKVTVGYMYMLKLIHLVDDKIHARSTGPYSLVTQQPLGGKAQFGGQRFGEMEVWALEAYGSAYTLQEILTVKSDDVVGRVKTYESIVKGENVPKPGVPESFKVLIKELQSLTLDISILDKDGNEIQLRDMSDDDDDYETIDPEQKKLLENEIPADMIENTEEDFVDNIFSEGEEEPDIFDMDDSEFEEDMLNGEEDDDDFESDTEEDL